MTKTVSAYYVNISLEKKCLPRNFRIKEGFEFIDLSKFDKIYSTSKNNASFSMYLVLVLIQSSHVIIFFKVGSQF